MFSAAATVFSGTVIPLTVLAFSLVVGIVVSKLSERGRNGGWHRSR